MEPKEEAKPEKAKPEETSTIKPIFFDVGTPSRQEQVTNLFVALPTRYLIFAIGNLVLIIYTVPLLFFALFSSISFFFYIYPAGLLAAAIFIFNTAFKIKPRLGVEKATLILSIASVVFLIVYLIISFSYAGIL